MILRVLQTCKKSNSFNSILWPSFSPLQLAVKFGEKVSPCFQICFSEFWVLDSINVLLATLIMLVEIPELETDTDLWYAQSLNEKLMLANVGAPEWAFCSNSFRVRGDRGKQPRLLWSTTPQNICKTFGGKLKPRRIVLECFLFFPPQSLMNRGCNDDIQQQSVPTRHTHQRTQQKPPSNARSDITRTTTSSKTGELFDTQNSWKE